MADQSGDKPTEAPKFNAHDFRNKIATLCTNVNLAAEMAEKHAPAIPDTMRQCIMRADRQTSEILRMLALDGAP